jgi:hypothetical protein
MKFDPLFRHRHDYEKDIDLRTRYSSDQPYPFSSSCESCGEDSLSVNWIPDPFIAEIHEEDIHFYLCGHCERELMDEV